jgi:hypothetical protein
MSTAELASSYAALILADDGVEITVSASIIPVAFFARRRNLEKTVFPAGK